MRIFSVAMLFGLLLLAPVSARADSLYFEFNPDLSKSLLVANSPQPVEQLFLPLNDHLNALEFWISTGNVAGSATFELRDSHEALLATMSRSIPAIPDSTAGTRFKVLLPEQIATIANQTYLLRISTAMPTLRVHYAGQHEVLAHDAEPQAAYTGGLVRIGGEERAFAFKSALYESVESIAPVISNITTTVISLSEVRLSFNATEPVDASVAYGPLGQVPDATVEFSGQYTSCAPGVQSCIVSLPISYPGTEHGFILTARDVWGNDVLVTGTFTSTGIAVDPTPTLSPVDSLTPTPLIADTSPPVITNPQAIPTYDSVAVAWTTDEAANSFTVIRFGINEITIGGNADSTLELEHYLTVGNLAQQTTYTAFIRSGDASGNESSTELEFTTLPTPTTEPESPTPTPSVSPTPTPSVTVTSEEAGNSAAQWSEPESGPPAGGYRIDIIGEDGILIKSITTTDTNADLGKLPEGATVIVYADNGDGTYQKVAAPNQQSRSTPFLERLVTMLPILLASLGGTTVIGVLLWMKLKKPLPLQTVSGHAPEEQFISHR